MATITISGANCTSFYGGVEQASTSCVGTTWDGNYNRTVVCRYKFTTDGYGATSFSFKTNRAYCDVRGSSSADDNVGRMRFAIGTNATQYSTTKSSSIGTAITSYKYGGSGTGYVSGSRTINLLPNTTYYLWVFPNEQFSSYTRFGIGNCTVTTSGSYGQASTISCSNVTLGNSTTVSLANSISGVKNTLKVYDGSTLVQTLLDGTTTATSVSWTPSLNTYAPRKTNGKTLTVTLKCTTSYNGTTWPGEKTKDVTLTIPDNADTRPTISSSSIEEVNTGVVYGLAGYIQNYSKVKATMSASAKLGASISSYKLTIDGASVSSASSPVTSAAVATSGVVTATLAVTDSRGFTASMTEDFTVLPYYQPKLTNVSIFRCDNNGNPDDGGTNFSAQAVANIASLNSQNKSTMTVAYRTKGGSYGTESAMITDSTVVANPIRVSVPSADVTYEARITLTDKLGNSTQATVTIPGQKWAMKFNSTATAVGFGKAPESNNVLEIPSGWELRRGVGGSAENALFPSDLSTELVANDRRFKTYSSVEQLGLTAGSATISDAWSALYNQSAILMCDANEFVSGTGGVPNTAGNVLMYRLADASTRGIIRLFSRDPIVGDYEMGVDVSGVPIGTWVPNVVPQHAQLSQNDTQTFTILGNLGVLFGARGSDKYAAIITYWDASPLVLVSGGTAPTITKSANSATFTVKNTVSGSHVYLFLTCQ